MPPIMKGREDNHSINNPTNEPIRIQCENALEIKGKYNEFVMVQDKLITLYIFHKSCPYESRVLSNNNIVQNV